MSNKKVEGGEKRKRWGNTLTDKATKAPIKLKLESTPRRMTQT